MRYLCQLAAMLRSIKAILIGVIKILLGIWHYGISPLVGHACRYSPTCSTYMLQAIEKHGLLRGFWLGVKRMSTCHPWGGHGHDPVPDKL